MFCLSNATLRSAREARLGGLAIAGGPGVEPQRERAPLTSTQEKILYETGRYVRALVAYGFGDRIVHVISLYGFSGAGDNAKKMRQNEQL